MYEEIDEQKYFFPFFYVEISLLVHSVCLLLKVSFSNADMQALVCTHVSCLSFFFSLLLLTQLVRFKLPKGLLLFFSLFLLLLPCWFPLLKEAT